MKLGVGASQQNAHLAMLLFFFFPSALPRPADFAGKEILPAVLCVVPGRLTGGQGEK